jgi:D-galactarolactone cycloisomerase
MSIKIKDIIVHVIKSELDIPFAFSQGWVKKRSATLVEIKTDEGLIGWGEAFCQGLEPPESPTSVLISTSEADLLLTQP